MLQLKGPAVVNPKNETDVSPKTREVLWEGLALNTMDAFHKARQQEWPSLKESLCPGKLLDVREPDGTAVGLGIYEGKPHEADRRRSWHVVTKL